MALMLKADPTGVETAAARAKTALGDVKQAAVGAETALDHLGKSAGPSIDPIAPSLGRASTAVEEVGRKSGFAAGGGIRMLGQQLSQVAQQGAVTGNYLGALAVQLPDMAMGFGSIAIAASIVATVALPMVINAFGGGKTAAEQMSDAVDRVGNSISALNSIKSDFATVDTLKAKYGSLDATLLGLISRQRQFYIDIAKHDASAAVNALADSYGGLLRMIDAGGRAGQSAQIQLRGELGLTAKQGVALRDAMKQAQDATDFAGKEAALSKIDQILAASAIHGGDLEGQVLSAALAMREVQTAADSSADAIYGAKAAADALATSGPGAGWLSGAIGQASTLAAKLWDAVGAAMAARDAQSRTNDRKLGDLNAGMRGRAGGTSSTATQGEADNYSPGAWSSVSPAAPSGGAIMTSPRPGQRSIDSVTLPGAIASGSRGGGGGGGGSRTDTTQADYDRLMASLDPLVAKSQEMAKAQETVNKELATGKISGTEAARALDLVRQKYGETTNAITDLQKAGGNAIDKLISGTGSLKDALRDMIKELEIAIVKQALFQHVTGATSDMSVGGLIMQGLFGGFHANGGTIPMGTTGIVGENGPEPVTVTSRGAMVTTNAQYRAAQSPQAVHVSVSVDDDGKIKAYVSQANRNAVHASVNSVKRALPGWQNELSTNGALA